MENSGNGYDPREEVARRLDGCRRGEVHSHVFRIEDDGGLGNACLLELPDGRVGVVDWGTQHPESLRHALEIICDARVAFVAATHAHADHTLGIALLLEEVVRRGMRVERFAYPASTLNKKQAWLTRARQKAKDLGIPTSAVTVDDFQGSRGYPDPPCLAWGAGWDVRVLSPAATMVAGEELGALRREQVAGNVTSMVILFRFDDRGPMGRVLLTGDATKATLDFAATTAARFPELSLRNECLVVPHHGARGGVPPWLFDLSEGASSSRERPADCITRPAIR